MQAGDRDRDALGEGLRLPLPSIPPRFFYDDVGSALFQQITEQPEYYPTRTELEILQRDAAELVERWRPLELAELGSGVGEKIRLLIAAGLPLGLEQVTMCDINASFLRSSLDAIESEWPSLRTRGVVGNFLVDLHELGRGDRRLLLLLAGTLGNLAPARVPDFLRQVAGVCGPHDRFLVGLDLVKDPEVLHAAYNDAAGVTAAFNRNVLQVIRRRFGVDVEPDDWAHHAFWDPQNQWIEMRLRAVRDTDIALDDWRRRFSAGDEVRTELSCKYTEARWRDLLAGTGLRLAEWRTDRRGWFALAVMEPM